MAPNPMAVLAVVILTLTFQALLIGEELAARTFPVIERPDEGTCGTLFERIKCIINFIVDFFRIIGGTIAFFIALVTFDIPGAPWWIRLPVSLVLGTGIIWPLVTLFRGN